MGLVYADIELRNSGEVEMARRGFMDIDEVKCLPIKVLVDTGSAMFAINENIQEIMQFTVIGTKKLELADGVIKAYTVVAPVEIKFKNRQCVCRAIILPGDSEPLLGAIPMEDMDLIVHCERQELIPHPDHGETGMSKLSGMRFVSKPYFPKKKRSPPRSQ